MKQNAVGDFKFDFCITFLEQKKTAGTEFIAMRRFLKFNLKKNPAVFPT